MRVRKRKASRKMGFCLAHITATESAVSGEVSVKYVATHTNHQLNLQECRNFPLPKLTADEVRRMFGIGVPLEKIMDG